MKPTRVLGHLIVSLVLLLPAACQAREVSSATDLDRIGAAKGFGFGSVRFVFVENKDVPKDVPTVKFDPRLFHYFLYLREGEAGIFNTATAAVEGSYDDSKEFLIPLDPGIWYIHSFVVQGAVQRFQTDSTPTPFVVGAGAATYIGDFVAEVPGRVRHGGSERFRLVIANRFAEAEASLKARYGDRFLRIIDGCLSRPGAPVVVVQVDGPELAARTVPGAGHSAAGF